MTDENQQARRSFRDLGNALVALGRRANIGATLIDLGKELRRTAPSIADAGHLQAEQLLKLRKPLDALRASIEVLASITNELRSVADSLAEFIGVDN